MMKWQQLLMDGYGRILEEVERALNGLSQADLDRQPHPDCNSMGWLAWHLTRVQDGQIADLAGDEQVYIKDSWYSRFNRPADPDDSGFGHSSEQVAAFRTPDIDTVLEYNRMVLERTKSYINGLSDADLDRELNEPWFQPLPTVGVRLISIMSDSLQHAGQIAYVRGLLKGKGWSRI
jgi:hypothetical protein